MYFKSCHNHSPLALYQLHFAQLGSWDFLGPVMLRSARDLYHCIGAKVQDELSSKAEKLGRLAWDARTLTSQR